MAIRKEQVVFAASLALLGWLTYGKLSTSEPRSRGRRGSGELEFSPTSVPDVALAKRAERDNVFERDLFSPPKDTQPLAQLDLELPPLEPLQLLFPPTMYGPAPRYMGEYLRRPHVPRSVPGLFESALADDDPNLAFPETDYEQGVADEDELTADELDARRATYGKLYDSIQIRDGSRRYGSIRNAKRYSLESRRDEAVEFIEVDPATGLERFPGQDPVAYPRERISDFAFADTVANHLELRRMEFADGLRAAQLESALSFGTECIMSRLEAPRALEIAEEIFRMCAAVADGDPRPALGLAQCLEAGFRFEEAWQLYDDMIANGSDKDPMVLASRAALLARFRLFAEAEAGFQEALRWGRSAWHAHWLYGRFLLERGRGEQAATELDAATKFEPKSPETKHIRVAMRRDYGWALLQSGQVGEAFEWFGRALSADDSDEEALAGALSARALLPEGQATELDDELAALLAGNVTGAGFATYLALGLHALAAEDWTGAKRNLEAAAETDPFRAGMAWRALSYLAEVTGYPDEAFEYIRRAHENDPTDAYTLFQRGRLLAAQDDLDGAEESFKRALDQDLDFDDALIARGALAARRGEHSAAERYYERALQIDEERPLVHSLRGFNALELDRVEAAEASFRSALRQSPDLASARNGLAWCSYVQQDSTEATTQFADLVETRRNEPETDASKLYAEEQIARIVDHEEKELWTDRFDRTNAIGTIGNGWQVGEDNGLTVSLREQEVQIDGQVSQKGRARAFREINAADFVAFEADVTILPSSKADRAGIFLAYEIRRRGEWDVRSEASVSRHQDGSVQGRFVAQGERDAPFNDLITSPWMTGEPMRLRIERRGEASDTTIVLFVDGLPVTEPVRMPTLGRSTTNLRFGVFVDGSTGRSVSVRMDNVEVIRRNR